MGPVNDESRAHYTVGTPYSDTARHTAISMVWSARGGGCRYGWGRNAPDLRLPEGVGFTVGKQTSIQYVVVQVSGCVLAWGRGRGPMVGEHTRPGWGADQHSAPPKPW